MLIRYIGVISILVGAAVLVGCESLAKIAPEPAPKYEPRSKGGNKSPYTVFGKTYTVLDSAVGYKEAGIASWYGKKFHGRNTSNGERYNMYAVSAAHKSLPIPTFVKVTNTENGKTLVVRVNDRGPFHEGRIIDLSYAAALKLGFAEQGTAKVIVEALVFREHATPQPKTPAKPKPVAIPAPSRAVKPQIADVPQAQPSANTAAKPVAPSIKRYIQVGVFSEQAKAETVVQQLSEFVDHPVFSKPAINVGQHSVMIGPVKTDGELEKVSALLLFHGLEEAFTVYDFD